MAINNPPILIELPKTQRYLSWLSTMIYLDSTAQNAKSRVIKRGEVYNCNLGMGIGCEEIKERPCVILQSDIGNSKSANTIVAPITHSTSRLPIVVPISDKTDVQGNLILDGNVLLGNIVCVSKARLGDYKTNLTSQEMKKIDEALSISLDVKRHYDKLNNILNDKLNYIAKLKKKIEKQNQELAILEELRTVISAENLTILPQTIATLLKK